MNILHNRTVITMKYDDALTFTQRLKYLRHMSVHSATLLSYATKMQYWIVIELSCVQKYYYGNRTKIIPVK